MEAQSNKLEQFVKRQSNDRLLPTLWKWRRREVRSFDVDFAIKYAHVSPLLRLMKYVNDATHGTGISISSTVMNFDYEGLRVNILDTPGHQDFSEDTYRALAAADNAIMLLDAAKGLEPQTRKLFEVCRMRNLPLFTFVNKMDRPAMSPYEIMDQIQEEFGLETHPILWPIGDGDRFKGVLDRMENVVHIYQKAATRGGKAEVVQVPMSDTAKLEELIDDAELFGKLMEDAELLEELISPLDITRVLAGNQSPLFFGSAMYVSI
jgi:peptide chain release factor 3